MDDGNLFRSTDLDVTVLYISYTIKRAIAQEDS